MNRPAPDPMAVARTVAGRRPDHLTVAERLAAVRELNRQGFSDAGIAARVGITARSVHRTRKRHGIPAAWHGSRRLRGAA